MAPPRIPFGERFWAKVDKRGEDECWPWLGARAGKNGAYGAVRLPGRAGGQTLAHRVAWALIFGPIPGGEHVLHSCDNPPCCNPRHLFTGTNVVNVADKIAKGRQARGEMCGQAKLVEPDVRDIRRRHTAGESLRALARAFDVDRRTIGFVVHRVTWRHI